MFAAEREKKIKEILLQYKHVDINTLCSLLSCSVATVRRDLDKLESEGFLTKAYGGAIINESPEQHVFLSGEDDPFLSDKIGAAQIAASIISGNDIIFLGPGNTCLQIARLLKSQTLSVITNSITIANELSGCHAINLILLGGDVTADSNGGIYTSGQNAIRMMSTLFVEKAFFSVNAISIKYGFSLNNMPVMDVLKVAMKQSGETYVVADSSKFGKRSMVKLADMTDIPNIITNVEIDSEYKEFCFKNKIRLFTSFDEK